MELKIVRNSQTLTDILNDYYNQLKKYLANVKTEATISNELFPIMFAAYNKAISIAFSSLTLEEATAYADVFSSWEDEFPDNSVKSDISDKRTSLYLQIISEKISPRCEWLFFQKPKNTDDMTNCVLAFGDILFNYKCADDYENAPALISDIFETESFASTMTLCNKIINLFICRLIREMQLTPPFRLLEKYYEEKHERERIEAEQKRKADSVQKHYNKEARNTVIFIILCVLLISLLIYLRKYQ